MIATSTLAGTEMPLKPMSGLSAVLLLVTLSWPALAQTPLHSVIREQPSCRDCRWDVANPTSVLALARVPDLWFGRIVGAAADPDGRIYIGDAFQRQVIRIDLVHGGVLRFGRPGRGPGEFQIPYLIAPRGDGEVFVLDPALRRVSQFQPDGAFRQSFQLPSDLMPRAMVATEGDLLFISGVVRNSQAGIIHKFDVHGRLLASFGEEGSGFGTPAARLASDGGPLWWDSTSQTLWFSRAGPRFELDAYTPNGGLRWQVRIAGSDLTEWKSPVDVVGSEGRISVQGRRTLGTIALLPLPGELLANVSTIDQNRMRIDVFATRTAEYVASWVEPASDPLGASDGRGKIFSFRLTDEPDVLARDIRLSIPQRGHRRNK